MPTFSRLLAENLNTVVVGVGFLLLEIGLVAQWSGAVAAIVGGVMLMAIGSWRYVSGTLRKRT